MNLRWYFISIATLVFFRCDVFCVTEFSGDDCVLAHNELRKKHEGTKEISKSDDLEKYAKNYARQLRGRDSSFPVHPTRTAPMRKRRSLDDGIDESLHLEMWDGDITYPSSNDAWFTNMNRNSAVKMGRSIHKFCCSRFKPMPHCPKEFFHGLSFPPTADGVVKDMYKEEEKHYDYSTGKSKTIYSHVDHFARIVWKNTTEVGCGQSLPNSIGCVFTVVLYRNEGAIGSEDNFLTNIGTPIVAEQTNPTMKIVLAIILVALAVGIIVLIYCCRHNIDEKYKAAKIEIDVLKAEQELETDSTKFWWARPLVKKREEETKAPIAAYNQSVRAQPSVNVAKTPMRPPRPSLKNIPRPSLEQASAQPQVNVNQLVNRYRGMSLKRQDYMRMNPAPMPPTKPAKFQPNAEDEVQVRRLSGKSVPPPKPPSTKPPNAPTRPPPQPFAKPAASQQSNQGDSPQVSEKPRPVPRKLPSVPPAVSSGGESAARRPLLPPNKPLPTPVDSEEERPLSIAERRKILQDKHV